MAPLYQRSSHLAMSREHTTGGEHTTSYFLMGWRTRHRTLLANSWGLAQYQDKGRDACFGVRRPRQPFTDPDGIHGGRHQQVLEMRFGQSNVPGSPHVTPSDRLRNDAFNARLFGRQLLIAPCLLTITSRLKRFMGLLSPDRQGPAHTLSSPIPMVLAPS